MSGRSTIRHRIIDPTTAKGMLAIEGPQRSLNKNQVERYRRDMEEGRWNPDVSAPIIVDATSGAVLDGQHRLAALAKMDDSTEIMFPIVKADEQWIHVIDTGRARRLVDTLSILGYTKREAKFLASHLNTSALWATGYRVGGVMTRSEQVEWIRNNPNAMAAAQISMGRDRHSPTTKLVRMPQGVVSTLWDIAEYGFSGETVVEFCDAVEFGSGGNDLINKIVSTMIAGSNPKSKARVAAQDIGYMLARVYRAWLNEEDLGAIFARRSAVREIPGFKEWYEANWT